MSYSFKTARSHGEKQTEKRGVLGTTIFFIIAAVIGRTIAHGQLRMHILCDLDLGGICFCWSIVHAYYVILKQQISLIEDLATTALPNIKGSQ